MPCALCLKNVPGKYKRIDFASSKATELEIVTIIDLHFWRQIKNTADLPESSGFICKPCWNSLTTFHQFYLTIENAHALLMGPLAGTTISEVEECFIDKEYEPPVQESTTTNSVEQQTENEDKLNVDILLEPIKRKRGRPKRPPVLVDIDSSLPISADMIKESRALLEEVLDEIKLNEIKIELPEPDLTVTDVLDEDISFDEQFEASYSSNSEEDSDDNYKETLRLRQRKRETATKKSLKSVTKKPKTTDKKKSKDNAQKTKKTEEFNEYIKNHIKLQCCNCNESSFSDFGELVRHCRSAHNERGYMLCCGRKFFRRGLLVDHLYTHANPDYFKCLKCGQSKCDRRSLELHMKLHEIKQIGRIYKCVECSKAFYNITIFKRHQLTHIPEEDRTVSCTDCDKQFPDEYSMNQHYQRVHLNKYAKICEVCGRTFQGKEALERHMQEHALGTRLLLHCDICGATLTTKYGLARHKRMMHEEENLQPMTCPICSKISPSLQAHQTHIKFSHNTARKHQCPMCEKAFKRPKDLREHMSTHTGDILYTCPHCPKTFNSNANMHSHRKKKHREEWEANRRIRIYGTKSQITNSIESKTTNTIAAAENVNISEN